jgi:hypothetical protein
MIHQINSSSSLLNVFVGSSSNTHINMNAPSSGMLRWNGNQNQMEVYDGGSNTWSPIYGSNASINLNHDAEEALKWAIRKMAEEKEWEQMAKKNKTIETALENLNQAREQLKITTHLVRENERLA